MRERIQKVLSSRGVASRRHAEEMISAGRVSCNGNVCNLGDTADPDTDIILVDGNPLPVTQRKVYIMLNKPRGYVTTLSDEKGRPDITQLVADCGVRVYPVGRLDMDSEGLLLLTNDGAFANYLMHPRHQVTKSYIVSVLGYTEDRLEKLKQPVELDGYRIRAPKVTVLKSENEKTVLKIEIHEGRNRQIRRMCMIAGMHVHRLKRVSEGKVQLGNLPIGKWRYLTKEEVDLLKK